MLSNIPYEEMPEKIEELAGDVERLETNWNELKEYIKVDWSSVNSEITSKLILDKMQEIESRKQ